MPRRRDDDPLPILILEVLTKMPFWVGPIAALVLFGVMRLLVPYLMASDLEQAVKEGGPMNAAAPVLLNGMAGASKSLAPWAGIGVAILWGSAELRKWLSRRAIGAVPACPACNSSMTIKTAKRGAHAGSEFWSCSRYPDCKGARDIA